MIEVKNVSKFYSQKKALDDLSLSIEAGRIFGLIGPNGAGKTTLIRILNQIIEPSSGQVLIGGIPLNPLHVKAFGYLPEERGLYREMKVLDHLIFLACIRGLTHQDAQKAAGHWLEKFEIQPWSNKRIDSLSKGMAQKVQFIGSILHDPQVVILDEPLSGFDPLNIQLILNEIKAMKEAGKTVIFSTHNMNSVDEICDEVGLINHGKLVAHDKVSSLKTQHKTGAFRVRYKGNQIAFANALWTGFEIVSTEEIGDQWFQSVIRSRQGQSFNDVFSSLSPALELHLIEEQLPGMQDVFLKLVTDSTP